MREFSQEEYLKADRQHFNYLPSSPIQAYITPATALPSDCLPSHQPDSDKSSVDNNASSINGRLRGIKMDKAPRQS